MLSSPKSRLSSREPRDLAISRSHFPPSSSVADDGECEELAWFAATSSRIAKIDSAYGVSHRIMRPLGERRLFLQIADRQNQWRPMIAEIFPSLPRLVFDTRWIFSQRGEAKCDQRSLTPAAFFVSGCRLRW